MSMLPWLKRDKESGIAGVMTVHRNPDKPEENQYDEVESAARDLIDACKSDDVKGVAAALRAAFQILDSEPHHESPHTYDSQNEEA